MFLHSATTSGCGGRMGEITKGRQQWPTVRLCWPDIYSCLLGYGYIGARTDTTQQSGQTPDKPSSFYTHLPAYEDGKVCSETSAYKLPTTGNYPEESIQKSRNQKHNFMSAATLKPIRLECSLPPLSGPTKFVSIRQSGQIPAAVRIAFQCCNGQNVSSSILRTDKGVSLLQTNKNGLQFRQRCCMLCKI